MEMWPTSFPWQERRQRIVSLGFYQAKSLNYSKLQLKGLGLAAARDHHCANATSDVALNSTWLPPFWFWAFLLSASRSCWKWGDPDWKRRSPTHFEFCSSRRRKWSDLLITSSWMPHTHTHTGQLEIVWNFPGTIPCDGCGVSAKTAHDRILWFRWKCCLLPRSTQRDYIQKLPLLRMSEADRLQLLSYSCD